MSWTTAAPVPSLAFRKDMPPKPNPQPSTPTTTNSPSTGPKPLCLPLLPSSPFGNPRSRTPIAPGKLAKLANALGVSTPHPPSSHFLYPLRSPSTPSLPSSISTTSTASTPSRHLLHVIPPTHLPSSSPEDDDDPDYRAQFRRGTLVAVHPTLQSQLMAIAREYALPSTGGMVLYLLTDGPGPRITDEAWKMLWQRVLRADRESAIAAGLSVSGGSNYSSRSGTPALVTNGYPSPASPAESLRKLGRRRSECESSYDSHSLPSPSPSIGAASIGGLGMGGSVGDLPVAAFDFTTASALPILAKVEFDIDKRKAPWYEPWRQRGRRQRVESSASTSSAAVSARELVLGHGRRKSGGLEEAKRRLVGTTHIPPPAVAQMKVEMNIEQPKPQAAFVMQIDQEDESEYGDEEPGSGGSPGGYMQLPDAEEEDKLKMSPLTGRALRRESTIPLDFETVVPEDNGASEDEDADPSVSHASTTQEQEDQEEESDYEEDPAVMDGEQLLREGKDPLADVFPSDEQTWAQMANDEPQEPHGQHTPDQPIIPALSLGGLMLSPSAAHQEESPDSGVSDCDDDNPEDVIALWKAKHEPRLDPQAQTLPAHQPANLDKSLPPSPTEPYLLPQKGPTARHVPPPLVLSPPVSPQVIIAPPSAGLEADWGRSYLAYLDEKRDTDSEESPGSAPTHSQISRPPFPGIEAIEILVNAPSGTVLLQDDDGDSELGFGGGRSSTDNSSSEGQGYELSRLRSGSLVGNEEFRSRALDELEKEIVANSPKKWKDDEGFERSMAAASQGTAQTFGTVENPPSAKTPKALPPTPPEVPSGMQQATQEGDETRHGKTNKAVPLIPEPSRWSMSSSSDGKTPSAFTPPVNPIKDKSLPTSPSAEATSEDERQRAMRTPPPVNSPTREAGSPGLDLSPDPFGSKPHRFGSEDHEGDVGIIEALSSPSAVPRAPPTRQSTSSSATSVTSLPRVGAPYHNVTSRFSQDSTTEDDSEKTKTATRERTNSIISLKGVRNLLRRSVGGTNATNPVVVAQNGLPLMSPGLNGHTTPQTRFNEEVPPVPSMGFFQHGSGMVSTPASSSRTSTGEKHHRADSGLDPFHFDQESRYPVRRSPPPSDPYISDLVPLASSLAVASLPPPTPTTPTSSVKTKGILKSWVSRSKRADSVASHPIGSPIESSAASQGKDSTSKKHPGNLDTSGMVHNANRAEFPSSPHPATPREPVSLAIAAEKQNSPTPLLPSPVLSEPRESIDTTTRLSDFEIVSPAPPGRPRRGTGNRI